MFNTRFDMKTILFTGKKMITNHIRAWLQILKTSLSTFFSIPSNTYIPLLFMMFQLRPYLRLTLLPSIYLWQLSIFFINFHIFSIPSTAFTLLLFMPFHLRTYLWLLFLLSLYLWLLYIYLSTFYSYLLSRSDFDVLHAIGHSLPFQPDIWNMTEVKLDALKVPINFQLNHVSV